MKENDVYNVDKVYEEFNKTIPLDGTTHDERIEKAENGYNLDADSNNFCWAKIVLEAPDKLPFWLDFLDTEGSMMRYSVKRVGQRTKTINDNKLKAIYYRSPPNVIFIQSKEDN